MLDISTLTNCYEAACELELQAFKPGNVSIFADGHGMVVNDFRESAKVSSRELCLVNATLGERIFKAVAATREAVGCNTNLGIILLSAPLLQAAALCRYKPEFVPSLVRILEQATIADTALVYKAIVLAAPGGLGQSDQQDVNEIPTLNLCESMRLASDRDRIALQYVTAFKDVFEFGILRYNDGLNRWGREDWAAAYVYTGFLTRYPDSHVERKYGDRFSQLIQDRMLVLDSALEDSSKPELLMSLFEEVDQEFKLIGINPGTTADLTVATILAVLLLNNLNVA